MGVRHATSIANIAAILVGHRLTYNEHRCDNRYMSIAETAAQTAAVFQVGDRVQSKMGGGVGAVRKIAVDRLSGEPLLIVSNGMVRWAVLAAWATHVPGE